MNILKISRTIFLLLAGLFFCFGSIVHAALLMHLPLDGNLNDISGNANNGSFQGGSTIPGFSPAVYNQGLNFDGNNDYITVPSFDPGSTFSASLWVNHDNIGALNTFIEHTNNGNNRNDFYIGYDNSNNQLTVELEDNNQWEGGACGDPKFCTGIVLNSNRWYHVVVTVTPTTLNVYIDTTLAYTATHSTTVNFGNGSWLLGGDTDNNPVTSANNDYLDGRIDEVRIYNHELSQIEISALYGLIAEWTFDNCDITAPNAITDSSGNGYHATGNNGVTTATGRICTAGSFDGTDDYASLPGLPNLNTSFTISSWINPNAINSDQRIFADDESNSNGFAFSLGDGGDGRLRLFSRNVSPIVLDSSAAIINTGSWYHVVAVHDSINKTRQIFVNGADVTGGPQTYTGTWGSDNGLASIGGETDGAGSEATANWRFNGLIDEVRIYNRTLSTEEISGYYTNPDPLNRTCPTCGGATQTIILSTNNTETLGGLSFSDGSLAEYDPVTDSSTLYFNENLFSGGADINAVHVLSNGIIILSTDNNETLGGLSFGDDDLVAYDPSTNTATLYFDGGNLFSNNNEDIDAVYIRDNGNIILSTTGGATLGGISFADGDLIEYIPSTDSASLFFDESNFSGGADIDGVHILANGNILISTNNTESLPGLANFEDGSIVEYDVGTNTASLYFDENLFSGGADIDALTLPISVTPLHHIQITHDGTALTCEPESITVTACANATCTAPHYTSDVSITLTPPGWVGGDTQTIISGSSIFQLRNSIAGTITLAASASSPATSITPSPSVTCFNSVTSSTSCDITYYDSGFIYTIPTQTSCATSNSITLQAVRLDTISQICVPAFQNVNRNLKVWASYNSPAPAAITGTPTVTLINGNGTYTLPSTEPASANVNMSFVTLADETFTVTYPDAGRLVLNAKYEGSAANSDTGLTMLGNSTFVVKPAKLYVYSDDANASCTSADPANADCNTPFRKTGENFNLKIRAACADNTVTPNFQLNGITLASNLVAPISAGSVNANLAVTSFNTAAADNGEHIISTQNVDQVGVFTFTATLPVAGYLGETIIGSTALNTSSNIGRFTPDHFDTQVTHGCAGGSTFTYSGQPLIVTAFARNQNNLTTLNYRDGFAFGVTLSDSNAIGTGSFTNNTISSASFTSAIDGASVGAGTQTNLLYTFTNKDTIPGTIKIKATDQTDTLITSNATEGTTEIRSGRTHVENSFGSELVDMAITAQVEFYNTNGFEINTADTCSVITATLTDIGTDPINIGTGLAGETCIWDDDAESGADNCTNAAILPGPINSQFEEPPIAGSFNLFLLAPDANNTGDIGITLISPTWLKYDWDGDGNHDNDPTGVASFGLYRGDDRVIYWREVF